MIHVSGTAREYLERLRARVSLDQSQQAIRLVPGPAGQLGLLPGVEGSGDTVIPHRGRPLLLIASEVARCFGTVVLDVASESGREQLVLRRSTRTSGRSLGTLNGGSWSSSRV
jgi:hypothetical protein